MPHFVQITTTFISFFMTSAPIHQVDGAANCSADGIVSL
nr:MAG TPA: hypothetical protein [Caudoviricetes sp.]